MCVVRYLRQCSAANPADIYVPSVRIYVVYGSRLRSHVVMSVLPARIDTAICMPMCIL